VAFLPALDRAAFATSFGLRLRTAGGGVGLSSLETFTRALKACPPESREALYWVARVTLVHRAEELAVFEAVFSAVFGEAAGSSDPNARRQPLPAPRGDKDVHVLSPVGAREEKAVRGLPWSSLASAHRALDEDAETPSSLPERHASGLEALAEVPFESLDPDDLSMLDAWLVAGMTSWPKRRSRRSAPHHAGHRVNLRPTLARARHTGFEPMELVRTRPIEKPRRVVMICDVSQSMQHQAAAYLHLMRAVATTSDAEVFAFATHLTRLTPALSDRSATIAIEQATARVTDRFGGTKIASNLRRLLASNYGEACRGAIVILASDGWDSDPPEHLAAAMARLSRRAHRIIWINPRAAAPEFTPTVGAMAAALPYCDAFLPADTIRSLTKVMAAIVASS
jgi:uncharacterized protein with von Willebrand factor type A (vWA) domain